MDEQKDKTGASEPEHPYPKIKMQFFSSVEEENEAKYKYWAGLSPIEHLENVIQLIKQIYREELLENQKMSKKMKFNR